MKDITEAIGLIIVECILVVFYTTVRQHPTWAVPFAKATDFPKLLRQLSHFWKVTLGGKRYLNYRYNLPENHAATTFAHERLVGLFPSNSRRQTGFRTGKVMACPSRIHR